jgi:hypothetical protein
VGGEGGRATVGNVINDSCREKIMAEVGERPLLWLAQVQYQPIGINNRMKKPVQ